LVSVHDETPRKPGHAQARRQARESGFTVTELLIVIAVIGILSAIMIPNLLDRYHKARLARCMIELRGIQTGLYMFTDVGMTWPDADSFWSNVFPAAMPGPYHYLVDAEDPNAGHGNDLDGYDEQNPGTAPRTQKDIKFVLMCDHDHAHLCWYVYIEDEGAPQLATSENNPHYDVFIKKGEGKAPGGQPGGGKGGGKK
jgi:prepilin-type N-terminal cleavage/methylation domain-containing protein